jgi:hypothetical protein
VRPRRSTGGVRIDARRKEPVYELRFRANGQRRIQRLGTPADGWTREKAEAALRHVLADVERGRWRPPAPEPVEKPREIPSSHAFASEWFARQSVE